MKADLEVMDALIDSVIDDLTEVRDELNRVIFRIQYERLKKEHKELQEKVDNLETFNLEFDYCPHCDSKIYAHTDFEYCPYCGEKLD